MNTIREDVNEEENYSDESDTAYDFNNNGEDEDFNNRDDH